MAVSVYDINNSLKSKLPEGRFAHSLNVAACARELALRFGCDEDIQNKAYLAGILHDCSKQYDAVEMLALAEEAGIKTTPEECRDPVSLLHARLSVYVAVRDYMINDKDVLQAVEYHPSGGLNMTMLDKIIGLADAIEPLRKGTGAERLRKLAETDLEEAYLEKHILYMTNIIRARCYLPDIKVKVYNALITESDNKK
jgi:predicted HD superfamily hydrolase involved in NAD metabolism